MADNDVINSLLIWRTIANNDVINSLLIGRTIASNDFIKSLLIRRSGVAAQSGWLVFKPTSANAGSNPRRYSDCLHPLTK